MQVGTPHASHGNKPGEYGDGELPIGGGGEGDGGLKFGGGGEGDGG